MGGDFQLHHQYVLNQGGGPKIERGGGLEGIFITIITMHYHDILLNFIEQKSMTYFFSGNIEIDHVKLFLITVCAQNV